MADQRETIGVFGITRLRTPDPTYTQGAVVPGTPAGPIATAVGPPIPIAGPIVGTVGASEWWNLFVTMPPAPDVVWVMICGDISMQVEATASAPTRMVLHTFGVITTVDETRGPSFGSDDTFITKPAASGGNYDTISLNTRPDPRGVWVPLNPDDTSAGWTMSFNALAGAVAITASEWRADLSQVRLVGYPANMWNTGQLWEGTRFRGS